MTVESAVSADDCVGVGVDVGAFVDSVVILVGACDASARMTYGVNDVTGGNRDGRVRRRC